jgi:HAD superfamily hydrolase (TIGR01459 family)
MTDVARAIPILDSVSALADRYDAWICDIWGVMHNGLRAFAAACEAGREFRARGGSVVLVSNAPRPAPFVIEMLSKIGVPRDAYDAVVTSGDVTRILLERELSRPVFHLGPERDRGVFENLAVRFAAADAAEVVVNTGLFDDTTETPDDYRDQLAAMQRRGVRMICANPDIKVERGDTLIYCAGALAELYEAMGGEVIYAGKPHLPIYDMAFAKLAELRSAAVPRHRILAIGDGLRTDMAGAEAAGLPALFIASLLHVASEEAATAEGIAALFKDSRLRPIGAQLGLRW